MPDIAIDSNAYVAYQANDVRAVQLVNGATRRILPAPVLGELYFGALNSGRPASNQKILEQFLRTCDLALPDAAVCQRYGQLRVALRRNGTPLPVNDVWIAAICLELSIPLMTRDQHFIHVPHLAVLAW
jgi:tRNA(fMet)-specific endonuclease VapC